jgi:Zn-dependent oligopeptidase
LFRAFPDDESQEKPTLESFGVTGAGPVNSFENIISKIEEIEKRVSDVWYLNSNKDLDNFRTHKESFIRMLSSHEVNIYMSMCLHLSVCPAWCMSVS